MPYPGESTCPECGVTGSHIVGCSVGFREKQGGSPFSRGSIRGEGTAFFNMSDFAKMFNEGKLKWPHQEDLHKLLREEFFGGPDGWKRRMMGDWDRRDFTRGWPDHFWPEDAGPETKAEELLKRFGPEMAYHMLVRVLAEMEDLESVMMVVEADLVSQAQEIRPARSYRGESSCFVTYDELDFVPIKPTRKKRPHDHLREDPAKKRPR